MPPTPDVPIVGTAWVLNGVLFEFGAMSGIGIHDGRITFAADGTIAGSTSCRNFLGTWALEGDTVVASAVQIVGECAGAVNPQFDEIFERVLTEGRTEPIEVVPQPAGGVASW